MTGGWHKFRGLTYPYAPIFWLSPVKDRRSRVRKYRGLFASFPLLTYFLPFYWLRRVTNFRVFPLPVRKDFYSFSPRRWSFPPLQGRSKYSTYPPVVWHPSLFVSLIFLVDSPPHLYFSPGHTALKLSIKSNKPPLTSLLVLCPSSLVHISSTSSSLKWDY